MATRVRQQDVCAYHICPEKKRQQLLVESNIRNVNSHHDYCSIQYEQSPPTYLGEVIADPLGDHEDNHDRQSQRDIPRRLNNDDGQTERHTNDSP